MKATSAAYTTFKRVFNDPLASQYSALTENRVAYYGLLNAFYENSVFDDIAQWSSYKSTNRLYRQTRSIYNPTRRLVNFYVQHVYRGRLSMDGQPFEDGTPIAIPFAADTDADLLTAIAQLWQWSNWLDGKDEVVLQAAKFGEVLVEVVDELDRAKVTFQSFWPGFVDTNALDLDAAGNVQAYALEYQFLDQDNGQIYTYRKEVDKDQFAFFRDGDPFDYGAGSSYANPYGFVPACWVRHTIMDRVHGAPAVQGSINKLDELNSLASLIHDEIAKIVSSPVLVSATGGMSKVFGQPKKGPTDEELIPDADRETLNVIKGGPDAAMSKLPLQLADGILYMEKLLTEIERDFPELTMYERLADMSQVTGPAVERLFSNVSATVDSVAARHDQQSTKLFAMGVAIAGERIKRGDWQQLDSQQEKFRGFDLMSYEDGRLDLEIRARRLFKETERELADTAQIKATTAVSLDGIVDELEQLKVAGYTEDEAEEILERKREDLESAPLEVAAPGSPAAIAAANGVPVPGVTPPQLAGAANAAKNAALQPVE